MRVITPVRRDPPRITYESRVLGKAIREAIKGISSPDWVCLIDLSEKPERVRYYCARLRSEHAGAFEFTSSIEDGVGRLYARPIPADAS